MSNNLSPKTAAKCVDALRHIRHRYSIWGRLTGIDMQPVHEALARVDAEAMYAEETARQAQRADVMPISTAVE